MQEDETGQTANTSGLDAGSETTQDAGQDSSAEKEGSTQARAYTEEEIKKLVNDGRADLGRELKAAREESEKLKRELADVAARIKEYEQEKEQAEYAKVKDDPDKLSIYQQRQEIRKRLAEATEKEKQLAEREQKLAEQEKEIDTYRRQQRAATIAAKYNVDPTPLAEYTDGSVEAMEGLAKAMARYRQQSQPSEVVPDSLVTLGGGGRLSTEQLEKMTMEQYADWAKKHNAI